MFSAVPIIKTKGFCTSIFHNFMLLKFVLIGFLYSGITLCNEVRAIARLETACCDLLLSK